MRLVLTLTPAARAGVARLSRRSSCSVFDGGVLHGGQTPRSSAGDAMSQMRNSREAPKHPANRVALSTAVWRPFADGSTITKMRLIRFTPDSFAWPRYCQVTPPSHLYGIPSSNSGVGKL